jgi:hypothetical protein
MAILLLTGCAEKVRLFGAKIKSTDINGSKTYGPKNVSNVSPLIKDPMNPVEEYSFLGKLISPTHVRDNVQFIDLIFQNNDYGVVDKAYIEFLDEAVIDNLVVNTKEFPQTLWDSFIQDFSTQPTYIAKKKLLFSNSYRSIRRKLEQSIYDTIPNNIVQTQKIETLIKGSIESNLKAAFAENKVDLSADLKAKLESLVKSSVEIKGQYVDIELRKEFVTKIVTELKKLKANPPITPTGNPFLDNYVDNFVKKEYKPAYGYSLLKFNIKYNTSSISKTEIDALINADATITPDKKQMISAKVFASFSVTRDFSGESKSTKNYLVRYAYNKSLEDERR